MCTLPSLRWFRAAAVLALGALTSACSLRQSGSDTVASASKGARVIVAQGSCLNVPVDLTLNPGTAPRALYVNDIRLGYAKVGGVYLSRLLCDMHGDALCRFVEAHEQAHHYTHTIGPDSRCAEVVADCWAAIHSDDEALDAAMSFFSTRSGTGGHYDEPRERARTIVECSAFRGRRQQLATIEGQPSEPDLRVASSERGTARLQHVMIDQDGVSLPWRSSGGQR